jgi:hypothetical protein
MTVRCTGNSDSLAKVADIRRLGHERHLLVLAWYYTAVRVISYGEADEGGPFGVGLG